MYLARARARSCMFVDPIPVRPRTAVNRVGSCASHVRAQTTDRGEPLAKLTPIESMSRCDAIHVAENYTREMVTQQNKVERVSLFKYDILQLWRIKDTCILRKMILVFFFHPFTRSYLELTITREQWW